ncbi:MAG: hypothetical protein JWM34_1300 [Ilumatobacteraceae bacterium]|nr:hypothetical protein [Ilumatobacteraceae bacterium]
MEVESLTCNALVYEAVQRTYRNAIVGLLRDRLSNTYPNDYESRVSSTFPTWPEIVAGAVASGATGVVTHDHSDVFAYLDVSHFTVLVNNYFEVIAPVDGLPPDVTAKIKQQTTSFLREVKTIRDPLSHPTDDDLDPYDALRAVDTAMRALNNLGLEATSKALDEIRSELARRSADSGLSVVIPMAGAVSDSLPPRDSIVADFVGRASVLEQLWDWLADSRQSRWLICGEGGKGKSAIAYHFASEVARRSSTEMAGVFWMSAKRRKYADGSEVAIAQPDFWDLESALDRLLMDFGWTEHRSKPVEAKAALVAELAREFPALVIVDDVDSLDADAEDAIEYLTHDLTNAGAKVLLTSRRAILGMGKATLTVSGLNDDESEEFLQSRLRLFSIESGRISRKQSRRIIEICEGSPLYMEDLLRLCMFLSPSEAIKAWLEHSGDGVRRYALQREIEMLSTRARDVLRVCALSEAAVTAEEIRRVLGVAEDSVVEALAELRRTYLVPTPVPSADGAPRFLVNRNLAQLVHAEVEGTQAMGTLLAGLNAVVGLDLKRAAPYVLDDYRRQAELFVQKRDFNRAEETLQIALKAYPNEPRLLSALGYTYSRWSPGRPTDARSAWKRAYELGSRDRRMYLSWADFEQSHENWSNVLEVAEWGLERLGSDDPALLQRAGFGASRLAQSLRSALVSARAEEEFTRSDSFLRRAIRSGIDDGAETAHISRSYRAWVVNAALQQKDETLCRRLTEWLKWNSADPMALEEAKRQGKKCPEVTKLLASLQAS